MKWVMIQKIIKIKFGFLAVFHEKNSKFKFQIIKIIYLEIIFFLIYTYYAIT